MEGAVIDNIVNHTNKPVEIGGHIATPSGWSLVHKADVREEALPKAPTFTVYTLGALADYLKTNRDGLDLKKLIAHVETPCRVTVGSILRNGSRDRELFIAAEVKDLVSEFVGTFRSQEDTVIGLQTRFLHTDERAAVLRVVGTIKAEDVVTSTDDGVTQQVTASAGTVLKTTAELPNPVTLNGFRTFRDIRQPATTYVLRGKRGQNGQMPTVALFEADGGAWQLGTIADIHNWLKTNLPDGVAVLA